MRALGVMDGVRRPGQVGGPLNLQRSAGSTAAVAAMPQDWARPVAVDGLRRIAQVIAAPPQPALATAAIPAAAPTRSGFSPLAIASLAGVPMLAAGSILGARTILSHRHAIVTIPQATAATAASPAPAPAPTTPTAQEAAAPAISEGQSLQTLLDGSINSSTYSLYVQDLKTGQLATVGPDRVFESASLYKLFVAAAVYHRIDTGQISYSSSAGGGTGRTVSDCLNLMITISDNGCGQALGGLIGWSNLTSTMHAQGYDATNLTGEITYTSARDVALLYQRLYNGSLLSSDSINQFLILLKSQKVNNRLPQGLPAGTTIAHKTGDLDGYLHDAGIVFGPKTNYLVVMMGAPGAVPSDFAKVSQQLASFFAK